MPTTTLNDTTTLKLACESDVYHLRLGGNDKRPFILSPASLGELELVLDSIEDNLASAKGLIITGSGDGIFCAGADLDVFAHMESVDQISQLIKRGQSLFHRIESLPIPSIAAIAGTAVGGGLELALACHLRLASDSPKTKLGLPEVRLGILPAWGGTTRLVDTIGLKQALPLLLSGRLISGRQAHKIGLAAECCPEDILLDRAKVWIRELNSARTHGHSGRPKFHKVGVSDYLLHEAPFVRKLVLDMAEKKVHAQTQGHYPAPLALISILRKSAKLNHDARFGLEHDGALKLAQGRVAKNLISIFRRNRDKDRGAPYNIDLRREAPIRRVAVVGAGVMGTGIATALLLAGQKVVLLDPFPSSLIKASKAVDAELEKRVKRRRLEPHAAKKKKDGLLLTDDYQDLSGCDLIIESVPEIADLKREVLANISAAAHKNAVICTNTSSLSIEELGDAIDDTQQLYGLHFFNPAPKMPLVEIVRGTNAQETTIARLARFCRKIGKTPVVVKDRPAFVVNRILAPYLLEAQQLLIEGAPLADIEKSARAMGLPMGPFELMDSVGLDIIKHVCDYLSSFPEFECETPVLLDKMVSRGEFGRKTNKGFYRWRGQKKKARSMAALHRLAGVKPELQDWPHRVIIERLSLALEKEAIRILDEGVVSNPDDLDLASIFGMGFPPFTGGIASWVSERKELN
ncbi:MAG: 3-hydroxyacyl-CoA dehydrogenase/enoyl-CoA hydratase/3-hydroxybutyryl-CoA epimerase [Planctomycetota bacterium]|jgi:3-hydroxyacyl-CoA dehydrogenase/enoyl-CoA hydratase/3-hydroxybutyryl-CoA epimerase